MFFKKDTIVVVRKDVHIVLQRRKPGNTYWKKLPDRIHVGINKDFFVSR